MIKARPAKKMKPSQSEIDAWEFLNAVEIYSLTLPKYSFRKIAKEWSVKKIKK